MPVSLFDQKTGKVYDAPDDATAQAQIRAYGLAPATAEQVAAHDAQLRSGGTLDQLRTVGETASATLGNTVAGVTHALVGGVDSGPLGVANTPGAIERRQVNPGAAAVGALIPDVASTLLVPEVEGAGLVGKGLSLLGRSAVAGAVAEGGAQAVEGKSDYSLGDAALYGLTAGALEVGGHYAFSTAMKAAGATKDALGGVVDKARQWAVKDALAEPQSMLRALKMSGDDVSDELLAKHTKKLNDAIEVINERMSKNREVAFTPSALRETVSDNTVAQQQHFFELATQLDHAAEVTGSADVHAARNILRATLDTPSSLEGPALFKAARDAQKVLEAADLAGSKLGTEALQALDESLRNEGMWGKAAKSYVWDKEWKPFGRKGVGSAPADLDFESVEQREALDEFLNSPTRGDKQAAKAIAEARQATAGADEVIGARVMGSDVPVDEWVNTPKGRGARERVPGEAETGGLWNKAKNYVNEIGEEEVGGLVEGGFKKAGMAVGGAIGGIPGMAAGYLGGRALNRAYGPQVSQFAWKALKKGAAGAAKKNPLRAAGAALGAAAGAPYGGVATIAGAFGGQRAAKAAGEAAASAGKKVRSAVARGESASKRIWNAAKESAEKRGGAAAAAEAPGMRWTQTAPSESVDEYMARMAEKKAEAAKVGKTYTPSDDEYRELNRAFEAQAKRGKSAFEHLKDNPEKVIGAGLIGAGGADALLNPDDQSGAATAGASVGLLAMFLPSGTRKELAALVEDSLRGLARTERAALTKAAERAAQENGDLIRRFARKELTNMSPDQVMFKQWENIADEFAKITKKPPPSMEDTGSKLFDAIGKHVDYINHAVIEQDPELQRLAKVRHFDVLPGGGGKGAARAAEGGAPLTDLDQELLEKHFGTPREETPRARDLERFGLPSPPETKISEAPKLPQLGQTTGEQAQAARAARLEHAENDLKFGDMRGNAQKWVDELEHDLATKIKSHTGEDEMYSLADDAAEEWAKRYRILRQKHPDEREMEYVRARLNDWGGQEMARVQKQRGLLLRDEERLAEHRSKASSEPEKEFATGDQLLEDLPEHSADVWRGRLTKLADEYMAEHPNVERSEVWEALDVDNVIRELDEHHRLSPREEIFLRKELDAPPPFDDGELDNIVDDAVNTSAGYHSEGDAPLDADDIVRQIENGETRLGTHDLTPWEEYHIRQHYADNAGELEQRFDDLIEEHNDHYNHETAAQDGYEDHEAKLRAYEAAEDGDPSMLSEEDEHYDFYKELADKARAERGPSNVRSLDEARAKREELDAPDSEPDDVEAHKAFVKETPRKYSMNEPNPGGVRDPSKPDGLPADWALKQLGVDAEVRDFKGISNVFGDEPLTVRDMRQLFGLDALKAEADRMGHDMHTALSVSGREVRFTGMVADEAGNGFGIQQRYLPAPDGAISVEIGPVYTQPGVEPGNVARQVLRPMFEGFERRGATHVVTDAAGPGQFVWAALGLEPHPASVVEARREFGLMLENFGIKAPDVNTLQELSAVTVPLERLSPQQLASVKESFQYVAETEKFSPDFEQTLINDGEFAAGKAFLMLNPGEWNRRMRIDLQPGSASYRQLMTRLGLLGGAGVLGIGGYEALKALSSSPLTFSEGKPQAQVDPELAAEVQEHAAQEQQKQQTRAQLDYLKAQSRNAVTTAAYALASPEKNTRTVPRAPGVSNSAGVQAFMGNSSTMRAAFDEKKASLAKLQQDPMVLVDEMADSFGTLADAAPDLHRKVVAQTYKVASFLADKMPGTIGASLTRPEGSPVSGLAVRQFALYYSAATDPSSVLTDLTHNRVQKEQVDTLKELWPDTYAQLKQGIIDQMSEARPTFAQRQRLDLLFDFGESLDTALSGRLVATHEAFKQSPKGQGKADPEGKGAPPPAMPTRRTNPSIDGTGALASLSQGAARAA